MIIYISLYIQSLNYYMGGVGGFGFRVCRASGVTSGGAFGFALGHIGAGFRGA